MNEEKRGIFILVLGIGIAAFLLGALGGYIAGISQPRPVSLEVANRLLDDGVQDGIWMMANRPCGYPNLTYDDPYGNMCCITEDTWYAVNGNKWVRMGLP
jgi:hypothetical protein